MNRDEIKEELRRSRSEFMKEISELPAEAFLDPAVMDDWSLKDVLAHICRWEGELVTMLFDLRQSKTASRPQIQGMAEVDRLNAEWLAADRQRDLDLVLSDFHGLRKQSLRRVGEFTDDELNDPDFAEQLDGKPLWQWIAVDTFEHEREHLEAVRSWRRGLELG